MASRQTAARLGVFSAVLVLLAAVLGVAARGDAGASNSVGGDGDGSTFGGCIVQGSGSCDMVPPQGEGPSDEELQASLPGDDPVEGTGPWPFAVLGTAVEGLYVRSNPERDGLHLGLALNRQTLWVVCEKRSRFDPEQGASAGPHWYQVTWPTDRPSDERRHSSPSDPAVGWAYKGLHPVGHDGAVPACP